MVMDKGMITYEGPPKDAIKFYTSEIEDKNKKKKQPIKKTNKNIRPFYGNIFHNEEKIDKVEHFWADKNLKKIDQAQTGMEVNVVIRFQLKTKPKKKLDIGMAIWDRDGNYISSIATDMQQVQLQGDKNGNFEVVLNFPKLVFNPSEYVSTVAVVDGPEFYYRGLNNELTVKNHIRHGGFVTANHVWKIYKE
jgi:hypothetical protein